MQRFKVKIGLGFVVAALVAGSTAAWGSAPNTILRVKDPISGGVWDRFGIAGPAIHHTPWGGDWSVDFYGYPGSNVRFRVKEGVPGATVGVAYGVIESNASSCASPYDHAGTAYRIGLYDGANQHVGWVVYAHVETAGVGLLPIGAVVVHGDVLGSVEQFPFSSCYQVSDPAGVHTHVELFNDHDYACYVPWAPGATLFARDTLGKVGSNNTGPQQPCN